MSAVEVPAVVVAPPRRVPLERDALLAAALVLALALVPLVAGALDQPFLVSLATRAAIYAVAATALNLVLGYAGLASFGHAAMLGIGGYAAGIAAVEGVTNGLAQLALAVGASSLFALATGALALRTRGVHFIMITMAFAQLAFHLAQALRGYGGSDGLVIPARPDLRPLLDLSTDGALHYACVGLLALALLLVRALTRSRFGLVLVAAREDERRVIATGFDPYRYRLAAYVLSGALAGVAGVALASFGGFISPSSLEWTRSAELMIMVILGGAGTIAGPVAGAIGYRVLEEVLSRWSTHWGFAFGLVLVAYVVLLRGGALRDGWRLLRR